MVHNGLRGFLEGMEPQVSRVLYKALEGEELSLEETVTLFQARGRELQGVVLVADELRQRAVGDRVTYVVNRNINFTNVCIKRCTFCAFSRDFREEEGYYLPMEEVVRRAKEAWELGATEVCIQAGLPPKMDGSLYIELCRAIKKEVPQIHIHGFSPEEVLYGAVRSGCTIEEYLRGLKEAGVGSIPGTAAEVLVQEVRDLISPGRITTDQWIEVITTAHRLGIPTTATIMYGHVETPHHWAQHLLLLRDIQRQTGGFTEFIPLSFVHQEAPMWKYRLIPGVRAGATGEEVVKMHAVARIVLNGYIRHIQSSWVKEGPKLAQYLLMAGCDDLGGTLINESISTSAGAIYGQLMRPRDIRGLIRGLGRVPVQRSTTYEVLRVFTEEEPEEPLDRVQDAEDRFGSYKKLTASQEFRYRHIVQRIQRRP